MYFGQEKELEHVCMDRKHYSGLLSSVLTTSNLISSLSSLCSSSSLTSSFGWASSPGVEKTIVLRFLALTTFCALGHNPLVLRSHTSHRGPTGRHITCKKHGRGSDEFHFSRWMAKEDSLTTHLPKSDQQMVDFTMELFWKPRLEIEPNPTGLECGNRS